MMRVSSTRLKTKLGSYLKALREGAEFLVTDRDRPVARLIPYDESSSGEGERAVMIAQPRSPSASPLGQVRVRPIRRRNDVDTTAILLEDRERR